MNVNTKTVNDFLTSNKEEIEELGDLIEVKIKEFVPLINRIFKTVLENQEISDELVKFYGIFRNDLIENGFSKSCAEQMCIELLKNINTSFKIK